MLKLHFFPTGIDMISIEVQTSQPYAARYIFAADFVIRLFFCFLCFVLFVFSKLYCYCLGLILATQDDYTSIKFLQLSANIQF